MELPGDSVKDVEVLRWTSESSISMSAVHTLCSLDERVCIVCIHVRRFSFLVRHMRIGICKCVL